MGHTGNYTREEAIAAIDKEGTLPDVLSFDPSKPAKYPNGRVFTDDVIDYRLAFLTKNECPSLGPQASHRRPEGVSIPRDAAFEIGHCRHRYAVVANRTDVRFWHKADIRTRSIDVCFRG